MLVKEKNNTERSTPSKNKLFFATCLGVNLLMISIILFYVDPVLLMVRYGLRNQLNEVIKQLSFALKDKFPWLDLFTNYNNLRLSKLRIDNGSMVNELLVGRLMSTKMWLYLFNVTNAERFIAGNDHKIKLQEIGPFVYQEYRTYEDLEINKDPGIMRYTPKLEKVFLLEESIGDPKDFNLTVPDIAMLTTTALISKYPFIVRQLFNVLAASNKMTAFVKLRAYDHIWGYKNPLIQLGNTIVPGLVYFKSVGLFERMYDIDVDFRLDIGTRNEDKFSVKRATKIPKNNSTDTKALIDNSFVYNDSYEGAAFPPGLTPDIPIQIYRQGLCKTFQMQYVGSRRLQYGGDAFVYKFHNDTFSGKKLCDTKGWCPEGVKDFSSCYFGLPVALSKSHFLDSDPRLLDKVEGLKPDREIHDTEIIIDPKIGVGVSGSMAMQMNLFLADIGFNPQTRRLKDTVLPVANIIAKSPPMLEEVRDVLYLVYSSGPYIRGTLQLLCTLIGTYLLSYSTRMMYRIWLTRKDTKRKDCKDFKPAHLPLLRG